MATGPSPVMQAVRSAQEIQKQLQGNIFKQTTDTIFKALVTDPLNDKNKIPESLFVQRFLPIFAGLKTQDDDPEAMAYWFGIAGSHLMEVSVIDTSGQVLFDVPAIQDFESIDPQSNSKSSGEKKNMSLSDIDGMVASLEKSTPIRADNLRNRSYDGKLQELSAVPKDKTVKEKRWEAIIARYAHVLANMGGPAVAVASIAPPVDTKAMGNLSDDEMEW